jgi:hypothetical protein
MTNMKSRTAILVTLGVWLAAVGSAAALTYDLNRPLPLVDATPRLEAQVDPTPAALTDSVSEPPSVPVLHVSTLTVVRSAPSPAVGVRPKSTTEISQMHCADWRELNMGSGRVQVCE